MDEQAIEHEVDSELPALLADARAIMIHNAEDAQDAAALVRTIADRRKAVELWFKPLVDAAHHAHRALTQRRAAVLERFTEPEHIVRKALSDYNTAEQAKRATAERVAREEAERVADAARIARAERALDRGDDEQAERILNGEAPGPVVVVPLMDDPPPKLDGVAFVSRWVAEVVDKAALVAAVDKSPHLLPLIDVNQKALQQMARALGDALAIPGVIVRKEQSTRVA